MWKVVLIEKPKQDDFRDGFFPRKVYYKRDGEALVREVAAKGGLAAIVTTTHNPKPEAYVRRIRNARKEAYARRYLAWLQAASPVGKEPARGDLSYMAAQAVRMELERLVKT